MVTPTVSRTLLPFDTQSPWRLKAAGTTTFAASADERNAAIWDVPHPGEAWVNYDSYSHPIYQATTQDPYFTITDLDHGNAVTRIRLPPHARPAKGSDSHMHVIRADKSTVDEHWVMTRTGATSYTCRRHEAVDLSGTGIGPNNGTRAYGGSAIGGLIRSWEISIGRIQHPLAIALRQEQMRPGPVWPATTDDHSPGYTGPIPMGSCFAIPPEVSVSNLGLKSKAAVVVARACQEFGAYVVDSSGSSCFYIEDDPSPVTSAFHAELTGPNWSARDLPTLFRALRLVTNNRPN